MDDVVEQLGYNETVGDVHVTRAMRASSLARPGRFVGRVPSSLQRARERWDTSLNDADLACLLQVLEQDLIPQLLNSYSPARHAPLDRSPTSR